MDVVHELYDSISRSCDIPPDRITDEATLVSLGIDSLASAEIITDMEIRLGRDLPADSLRRLAGARTVGEVSAALVAAFGGPERTTA
jgi:acyl carrier protein